MSLADAPPTCPWRSTASLVRRDTSKERVIIDHDEGKSDRRVIDSII